MYKSIQSILSSVTVILRNAQGAWHKEKNKNVKRINLASLVPSDDAGTAATQKSKRNALSLWVVAVYEPRRLVLVLP